MGYSLRTRSETKTTAEPVVAKKAVVKKAAPVKKAVVKKAAPAKKATTAKKATAASPAKKSTTSTKAATPAKKVSPAKKPATTKKATPAKKAAPTKKASPVKKETTTKVPEVVEEVKESVKEAPITKRSPPVRKPVVRKAAAKPKAAASKAVKKIEPPTVTIEEVSSPSLPEIEPIQHEEQECLESESPIVETQVPASTHIRFDNEEEEISEEKEEQGNEDEFISRSVKSEDFEALDDIKDDEPAAFDVYESNSMKDSVTEDLSIESVHENENADELEHEHENADEFDSNSGPSNDYFEEEEIKTESPASKPHSAFDAFTSTQEPETYNWNKTGSTYYNDNQTAKTTESPAPPTVIANPFGFGFTATTAPPQPPTTKPFSHFSFNSQFQSVSSPLDKLCQLTSQAQPIETPKPIAISSNNNNIGTSSFLPTSPAAALSKISRSPSETGEEKEIRSPSTIQSIIIDDKHEDFSAF